MLGAVANVCSKIPSASGRTWGAGADFDDCIEHVWGFAAAFPCIIRRRGLEFWEALKPFCLFYKDG